ncbi:putative hydrolase of HD superfamily [Kribbella voronezhensis]|jgi:putative hydrolase of HD superfamily|uniref:5'-deoxynucleotidase n=1 Tax=Kribbella voronezhensis TaxID=2512212 RepID=A0A4R7T6Z1_9ACTN|nr:HD domain-containing protein [Kribbella voronezhensis]TDU87601.1 putative hydrolase of HD superfamily [Kribbella voronezhensis]
MSDEKSQKEAAAIAAFAFEMGVLKRQRRSGWWHAGVRDPESIAEHSLRVAQLAGLIAAAEGGDPAKAAYMGLWHDSQETRIGDIPHSARPYVEAKGNVEITVDQVAGMAEPLANSVLKAVEEYEAKESLEAICARDADKLECLIQAVEYRDLGVQRVQSWIDSSRAALKTETAKRVADVALEISPLSWREK